MTVGQAIHIGIGGAVATFFVYLWLKMTAYAITAIHFATTRPLDSQFKAWHYAISWLFYSIVMLIMVYIGYRFSGAG